MPRLPRLPRLPGQPVQNKGIQLAKLIVAPKLDKKVGRPQKNRGKFSRLKILAQNSSEGAAENQQ